MRFIYLWRGHSSKKAVSFCFNILFALFLATFGVLFLFVGSVQAALTIYPPVLPGGQVGVSYSGSLSVSGGTPPYTWSRSGSFPPGLSWSASGNTVTISGVPTTAGSYTFWVTVDDFGLDSPITMGYVITIAAKPLNFVTNYLPDATEGSIYNVIISVTGGDLPYYYSIVSGSLPSGLYLDQTNGRILGTPAGGTAGSYTFTIGVTDDSTPPLSAQRAYSLVVKKGFYESVITISSTLSTGETRVYVDGAKVATLRGGQSTKMNFAVGKKPVISVDAVVSHPTKTDVRFLADNKEIAVSELSPDATFTYTPEYYVEVKTDPPQIAAIAGTGWYKEGSTMKTAAAAQIDGTTGTQYRFSYWLLPNGDKLKSESLSWLVSAPGKVTATYDTYYLLTVISPYSNVDGSGWQKAGTTAKWSIKPPELPMTGILGFFRGKFKPDSASGSEVMDAPRTVTVNWRADYTLPVIFIALIILIIGVVTFGIYRLLNPPPPEPAPAPIPPPPAPPTVVVLEGVPKPRLESTREQLLEQFGQLLQKYEEEIKGTVKGGELPAAVPVPEIQRLAAPKEEMPSACGYTSKNLLRTVVGNWRKVEEKVAPPSPEEKAAEKDLSLVTTWARDIYSEWEIFTCTLPRGHSGKHEGTTEIAYSLQNTITEGKTYTAKQKITPPKPHYTDKLPAVDISHQQVISVDPSMIPSEQAINPDEVIPPGEPSADS